MQEDLAIKEFRVSLIARHTKDANLCVKANLMTAYKSLQRAIAGIDAQLDAVSCGETACDLTHLRARLVTSAEILIDEITELQQSK